MRLGFVGADHEVTGSCHYLEACGKHILVDCGLEQGKDIYVNQDIPVPINQIDYVLLTHAHIDHSGRLPLLYKNGFHGDIISTFATSDLCSIMLRDSAHIQEFEAEWRNRKGKRAGLEEYVPLYTMADALGAIGLFHPCDYEQKIELCPGIHVRFRDVGHLLGSSSIEVWIEEDGVSKKIVFSGDIGNINQPLIKDPIPTDTADYVVMESTYGDRYHNAPPDYAAELASVINTTLKRGGNLVIPAFAVGRTQELLYFIRDIKEWTVLWPLKRLLFLIRTFSPALTMMPWHSSMPVSARSGSRTFIWQSPVMSPRPSILMRSRKSLFPLPVCAKPAVSNTT